MPIIAEIEWKIPSKSVTVYYFSTNATVIYDNLLITGGKSKWW